MKNLKTLIQISVLLLISIILVQCSLPEDDFIENIEGATIIGRWQAIGFEEVIRYEFTAEKRFSIYADSAGDFPTLDEFMEENPSLTGLDWFYEGDTVIIDLNFGNFSRLVPVFKCDNDVIEWIAEDNSIHSTFYRESHDISECN
jgi:hypothetical protein